MDPALSAKEAQIQAMARYADKLSVSLDGANLEISNMKVSFLLYSCVSFPLHTVDLLPPLVLHSLVAISTFIMLTSHLHLFFTPLLSSLIPLF